MISHLGIGLQKIFSHQCLLVLQLPSLLVVVSCSIFSLTSLETERVPRMGIGVPGKTKSPHPNLMDKIIG